MSRLDPLALAKYEGMWATPLEATPDGKDEVVRVWYGDGDLAAEIHSNFGLDIEAEDTAKLLFDAVRFHKALVSCSHLAASASGVVGYETALDEIVKIANEALMEGHRVDV